MGTATLYFPMGIFKKKKKNATIVKTFSHALMEALSKEDEKIKNYQRLKPRLTKFVTEYKQYFDNVVSIYGDLIQIRFKKKHDNYPDGFFALADKLGLNIEPTCNNGYYGGWGVSDDSGRSFNIRAKSK